MATNTGGNSLGISNSSQFAAVLAQNPAVPVNLTDPGQWRLARFWDTAPTDTLAYLETVFMAQNALLSGNVEITGNLTVDGTSNITAANSGTDWKVLTASGDATGATDTAAINTAITNAAQGSTIYFSTGTYFTNAPIQVGKRVILQGPDSSQNWGTYNGGYGNSATAPSGFQSTPPTPPAGAVIKPSATWAQGGAAKSAVILILAPTHYITEGPVLRNLCVDGINLPVTADGIMGFGAVADVQITNVYVMRCSGWGLNTASDPSAPGGFTINTPGTWKVAHCEMWLNGAGGINLGFVADSVWVDVLCEGNLGDGWAITGCDNSNWIACKAEWSHGHGFHVTGAWLSAAGFGVAQVVFSGCTTDANFQHGFFVDATQGTATLIISGCSFHRDGNNAVPDSWAGLAISQTAGASLHFQVIARNVMTSATTAANGVAPAYGLSVAGTGVNLDIDGARLIGNTGAVLVTGVPTRLQVGPGMSYATGDSSNPTVVAPANWKSGTATMTGGTVTVANTSVTAASRIWLTTLTKGGTQGAPYVGTITAGTSFVINSTNVADTSVVAYRMDEPG